MVCQIQDMLSTFFGGKELCKAINADEAVAYGAAVQGGILSGQKMSDQAKELLLLDVTPLSLGIETAGGVMTTLIPRGTTVPTRKTQMFSTHSDNQPAVKVEVYEGERALTRHNRLVGYFDLAGIPPLPRGVPQIEVAFEVDADGILQVSAQDKGSGHSESVQITSDKGRLSQAQIDQMVSDAEKNVAADEAARRAVEARNALEAYLYNARSSALSVQAGKLSKTAKAQVNEAVAEGLKWLAGRQSENAELYEEKSKAVEGVVGPLLKVAYQSEEGGISS
jgi:heat shock 70kDa protein 1/2/6/8